MTQSSACSNCGAGFVGDAAFCVQCGAPRHVIYTAEPAAVGTPRTESRTWLRSGLALVIVAALVIGAYAAFTWLTPPDQPAGSLPTNGTLNGRLRNPGDVHRYVFNGQAGTRTTIEVRGNDDLEPTVGLIGADFEPGLTPFESQTGLTRITWFNAEAKEYRVRIAGANTSKGTYGVTVTTSAPGSIAPGQNVVLSFPFGSSAAEYQFDGASGQRATLILDPDGTAAGVSRSISVVDAAGEYVTGDSNSEEGSLVVDWLIPQDGHYIVTADISQEAADEHELLLDLADPAPIGVDSIADGEIVTRSPVVDYVFTVTERGLYGAEIDTADALSAEIVIADSNDEYIVGNYDTGTITTGYASLEPGEYHLVVRSMYDSSGSFSLTLTNPESGTLPSGTSTGHLATHDLVSYTVILDPNRYFSFSLNASGTGTLDPTLRLVDEYGNQACYVDDYPGAYHDSRLISYDNCYISIGGLYYLQLAPLGDSSGDYVLIVDM
ncbi:MAG: hypothetical protein QOJ81_2236 [Chloroflexota bacterium]|nr:hypothetical protein [Chloroflexota bacterium]